MRQCKLSDSEISEIICLKLEPKPSYADYAEQEFWMPVAESWDHNGKITKGKIVAMDMVNDPAMTVMLLEKLLLIEDQYLSRIAGQDRAFYAIWSGNGKKTTNFTEWRPATLGRAVAEAFCLANRLEGVA